MTDDKTIFSDAHKKHLSMAMKGKKKSAEHRAKIAEAMRKRKREQRKKEENEWLFSNSVSNTVQ